MTRKHTVDPRLKRSEGKQTVVGSCVLIWIIFIKIFLREVTCYSVITFLKVSVCRDCSISVTVLRKHVFIFGCKEF